MITAGVSSTNPLMCRPASISVSAAIRPVVRSASKPTKIQSKRGPYDGDAALALFLMFP